MTQPFWERTYADINAKSFGDASQEILDIIPKLPAGGKVLDLGCGDGRNAIPLARAGFNVTAIDISETAIRKLDMLSEIEGIEIHSRVEDVTAYDFSDEYDLIIAHGCLHFVERNQWEKVIQEIKIHTTSDGFNVITVFTDEIPPPPDIFDLCRGLFREGELYEFYADWDTVLQRSYTFQDEHFGEIRHTHAANKLVARNSRTERCATTL